jgi:putative tryptophan/tyrosine transport system substrate-binding protein
MNNRRKLVIALGAGVLTAPLCSFAQQQGKVGRIGLLSPYPSGNDPQSEAFKQQLRDLGHVEGKTIAIDYLSAEGNYDRLPTLAADLVRRNVDVIMTVGGTPPLEAARNAARTIPVIFANVADPVGQGFVTSLARPGGNVTGITNQNPEVAVKLLALLKEIVPSAKRIAVLSNPTNPSHSRVLSDMQVAARVLRLEISFVNAGTPAEFEKAFAEIAQVRPAGLVILSDAMFNTDAARLTTLAARHRLPTMGGHNSVPESGGLMSYGADRLDLARRAAILADKILRGAKPADLPVEQPTKFELILNMRTAKDLGIKIPNSILVQATKVIK